MQSVVCSKSFARTLPVPHIQPTPHTPPSSFYKHHYNSGSPHSPSYPGPIDPSSQSCDSPQMRYTEHPIHFSQSPIQCRPSWHYTSSQSLSVPTNSSRQYDNHQNHVTNHSNPLSPHTTESVEIDDPPRFDEFHLLHYQYPQSKQSKQSKQYEYRRRSCPCPV